jgi:SagB-type dehydrogenase family enzyme
MKNILISFFISILLSTLALAQNLQKLPLLPPELDKGLPLMQCLQLRQSSRAFLEKELPLQELSNLLWAAFGINRPQEGKRTAPSAMNRQELDIYVILKKGIYLYDAKEPALLPVASGDYRKLAGRQAFAAEAPVNLVIVSDLARMKNDKKAQQDFSGLNAGYISQNVYLYCASAGLATVARAAVDKKALGKALKLRPGQEIILAQSVGYPK